MYACGTKIGEQMSNDSIHLNWVFREIEEAFYCILNISDLNISELRPDLSGDIIFFGGRGEFYLKMPRTKLSWPRVQRPCTWDRRERWRRFFNGFKLFVFYGRVSTPLSRTSELYVPYRPTPGKS